ncbi:MAG: Gfo/Idh/MocA family oxidoreductase [Armatimonadetes bacterium]|nr:Gfo/Idh/MocA family oxidoreductase [Armatimonadota bacterium]
MLRVGVIGMRGIGNNHAAAYHKHPKAEVVAVCDIVAERADSSAPLYGAKSFHSVPEMLANVELDSVSVCSGGFENGGDHFEPVMQCLEAGLHVLCEKPLSNSIDCCRQMNAKADEKGLYFGTNLNHRFVPPAARAKKWIEEGKLGQLLLMNMTMWIGNPAETSPWFHIRALHPHSLDIMRFFCGDVKRVHAFFNKAPGRSGDKPSVCWSNAQVNLEFANGVVGHLTGSYDTNPEHNLERAEVMGTEGRFVLDDCFQDLIFYPRRGDELTHIRRSVFSNLNFGGTFDNRIHRWIDQVTAGVPRDEIEASGLEGYKVQAIIEAAIQSFEGSCVAEVEV